MSKSLKPGAVESMDPWALIEAVIFPQGNNPSEFEGGGGLSHLILDKDDGIRFKRKV